MNFSSSFTKVLIVFSSTYSFYACNTTKFAEQRGGKQRSGIEGVSCTASPAVVLPGEPVTISVIGAGNFAGRFEQTLSGDVTAKSVLTRSQNNTFLPENSATNQYTLSKQGDYTVTLADIDFQSGLTASCGFRVYKECPVGTELVGANVAFVLDNSGSHGVSDCPSPKKVEKDGAVSFTCGSATNREKAVNYAVDIFSRVGEKGEKAKSYASVASFPSKSNGETGYDLGKAGWIDTNAAKDALSKDLQITRTPYGTTPYGDGIRSAGKLFETAPDKEKSKVVIFVTDGYPTDRNPSASRKSAENLRASGAKVVTVMVTGKETEAKLVEQHKSFLRGDEGDSLWFSDNYSSYDDYFLDLLGDGGSNPGLLNSISDQVVRVEDSSQLKVAFEDIIEEQALSCE